MPAAGSRQQAAGQWGGSEPGAGVVPGVVLFCGVCCEAGQAQSGESELISVGD